MVDEKYEKAKKRVEEIKGFYSHLIVYICVNVIGRIVGRLDGFVPLVIGIVIIPLSTWAVIQAQSAANNIHRA